MFQQLEVMPFSNHSHKSLESVGRLFLASVIGQVNKCVIEFVTGDF